jgi:hypothetical protein
MCKSGNGTFPRNALSDNQSRTLESFPIDHGIAMFRKACCASRRMKTLWFSSASRWVRSPFIDRAGRRIRTDDLLITNQLLYQLSYAGNNARSVMQ